GLRQLYLLVPGGRFIATGRQIETADSRVADVAPGIRVADGECVGGVQLVVNPGTHFRSALRRDRHRSKWCDSQSLGIECNDVDDGAVIDGVARDIQRERSAVIQRTGEIAPKLVKLQGRLLSGEGIPRVPKLPHVVVGNRAAQ